MPNVYCPTCGGIHPPRARCPLKERSRRKPTAADDNRANNEPWRTNYSNAEYQSNRQKVIELQHGRCADCGARVAAEINNQWITKQYGGEIHHIVPLCDGGTNEADNLILLCKSCHAKADAKRRKKGNH